ncbi:MAG TPA: RDD family protein [Thermoanaerobaculia bacterium]|nr:RDD family protein [Thermoanaerobaculia bacterium]
MTINGRLYCGTCKTEQLLDVRSGVDRTSLNLAGVGRRFGALFLDGLIVNLPMYFIVIGMMFPSMSQQTPEEPPLWMNFIGIPFMFASFFYEALMMQFKDGKTLGKMALRVRVVRPDGSPITSGQAWGRAALRLVLGCAWIIDYIPAFFTKEKTTLHDMAAGTRVVEF